MTDPIADPASSPPEPVESPAPDSAVSSVAASVSVASGVRDSLDAFERGIAPIVEVESVRKVYLHEDKPLEVLKGVSLRIYPREVLSIVGPSGAGKSTLLHLIGTLDVPSAGRILIAGADVTRMSNARVAALRNETIGFVFQFHHLLPEFTAIENVMMPGLIQGAMRRTELAERARSLLQQVGLESRATHRPSEMSGGEQQRVALARALVLTPKILLADEPTGNLDSTNSHMMHELFFKLNELHGTTMVIVTHNEALAARVPRRVKMRDGVIVEDERHADTLPAAADRLATAPDTAV